MKKIVYLLLFSLMVSLHTQAIQPIRKTWPVTQSDGTVINVYRHGNGFVAYFTSTDRKILVKNEQGDLCYALLEDGKLVASKYIAHEPALRTSAEKAFLEANDVASRMGEVKREKANVLCRLPNRLTKASTEDGLGLYMQSGLGAVNSIGTKRLPVIMAEFSDTKFKSTTTIAKMSRYYNEAGYHDEANTVGSVRDYFISQSRGLFQPTFDVVAKVTLDKNYRYYGRNNSYGDVNLEQFVEDAVKKAIAQGVDFNQYKDADGKIPLVSVLYAGKGEATTNNDDLLWPAQFDYESDANIGGFHFNGAFVGNELDDNGSLMGMGVFCHEFGHALGLPDFYCTDGSYEGDNAFGNWSIMDAGAYVYGGNAPVGYNAYERSYLGWLNIPEIQDTALVTLTPHTNGQGTLAVLVRNPQDTKEYFIFENRYPGTWYPNLLYGEDFGSGLLLTHVTYNANQWDQNILNNKQTKKRAYVVTADGSSLDYNAPESTLYGNGNNQILNLDLFDGTEYSDAPIYNITKKSDGSITFTFKTATGIQHIETKNSQPVTNVYYDLQGRRVQNPTRGIYIKDGKKIIVK